MGLLLSVPSRDESETSEDKWIVEDLICPHESRGGVDALTLRKDTMASNTLPDSLQPTATRHRLSIRQSKDKYIRPMPLDAGCDRSGRCPPKVSSLTVVGLNNRTMEGFPSIHEQRSGEAI